ncbi:MAG: T9SS type A sorting domain-containing protein, partial [Bacteroidales bacterium]|nr:T9SS type A sorting domain-containing protein [Bacteroidales bacterium]
AQLVFDGNMAFDQVGWVAIPIQGCFDYSGGALMMYVEHDCGDNSCVQNLGIVEPKFANTSYTNNNTERRIYLLSAATGTSFTGGGYRWSTRFLFNYTCQSPKSPITITTQVPQHDVGVIGINTPTSPNQYTANETVSVTVKNFGSSAASNFPVSYRLGNGTPVTENYSGSLPAGATGTKTFTAHADLTEAYMDTRFCAYTGLTGDALHFNDTFCMNLNVGDPCISRSTQAAGLDISNVTISTINNGQGTPFTNYTAEGDGMYTDYTATVPAAELIQGQTYPMSITHSYTAAASGSVWKTVYIDWNRNGTFEASEKLPQPQGSIPSTAANATTSFNVDVPTTSSVGLTRMRVICVAANFTNACSPYSYAGETEDYAVNIVPPKPVDLGVSQIVHPMGNVCMDTAATIKVLLKNYGSETQYFTPGNAAVVTVTLTGANTGTYTATVDAGSVAANNTYPVTIPQVNISSLGAFTVAASVSYPGDQFALNNATTVTANTNVLGPIVSNINNFEDNFDQNTGMTDLHFDYSRWMKPSGSDTANYIWVINSKNSPNANVNYGPAHDHTQINTLQADYGRYAMVEGKSGTVNYSKWTAATTKCLNMHRQTQYPIELVFYKYFYAPAAATNDNTSLKLTIEAGSGDDFTLVDTLTFANNRNVSPNWERFVTTIRNFNGVGQLKFTLSNHKNRIDPAIDDIYLGPGYPDLEVVNFIYPKDNVYSDCLIMGDSVHPTITLRNNGYSPLEEFDLRYIMSIGTKFDTLYEHVVRHIDADDTIHYTTKGAFLVHYNFHPLSFRVDCYVDLDKDTENDYQTVVTCTNSGVDDYAEENGVGLKQNEPNPASDHTRISYVLPEDGAANISIYSTLGQQLYSQDQSGTKGQNYLDVNTSNWAAGVYYYTLSFKDTSITKKMVIQK